MDGKDFTVSEDDDFEAEVEAVCQNQELMKFLEERSKYEKTYSLAEVEKKLGLERSHKTAPRPGLKSKATTNGGL